MKNINRELESIKKSEVKIIKLKNLYIHIYIYIYIHTHISVFLSITQSNPVT